MNDVDDDVTGRSYREREREHIHCMVATSSIETRGSRLTALPERFDDETMRVRLS